jgi:uncharacterized protein (TIGR00375 family)
MKFIADFHLHSKYSRATSKEMNLENLAKWAQIKGLKILGTGDFTQPDWLKSLKEKLEPVEPGLFKLKNSNFETRFILTTEVSCVFNKNKKLRKIHIIIFSPSFEVCEKINAYFSWIGNLKADGRPILSLEAKELVKIVLNICEDCLLVPSHIWTPWFSLFGSRSGFDSIEECFEDYSKYIFAAETGLSSDPAMNWRLSALDKITLISCSDAHSLTKIGREANVFEGEELSYQSIIKAIKRENPDSSNLKLTSTIEFFPQEGKYHYDGHRNCKICFSPKESKKYNNLCPVCQKPLTIGVLNRVEQLADRPEGFRPEGALPFKSLIPLQEIIGESLDLLPETKEVIKEYQNLIKKFGNEFNVLLEVPLSDLKATTLPEIAEGIKRTREEKVYIEPGYDGVYGKVKIFSKEEQKKISRQGTLF